MRTTKTMREIESAYNDSVALGRSDLAAQYRQVWLWLLQAADEDRAATPVRRPVTPRPLDRLKGRAKRSVSLAPTLRWMADRPETAEAK